MFMYMYMYMYIYMHMYMYMCIHARARARARTHARTRTRARAHTHTCTLFACICTCAGDILTTTSEDKSLVAHLTCCSSMLKLVDASTSEQLGTARVVFAHGRQTITAAAATGVD